MSSYGQLAREASGMKPGWSCRPFPTFRTPRLTSIALLFSRSSAGVVFRHPVFLVTFLLAPIGWFVAFIGMCVAESDLSEYIPPG
jgi:hypothetical protein